jgi:hypothetical protein
MGTNFDVQKIDLLEKRFLTIILKKEDIDLIKVEIKQLKQMIKDSDDKSLDKKKSITRLSSLQRACDRRLKKFFHGNVSFSLDVIYSLQFQSLIKNKRLHVYFPTNMIVIENESISINTLSTKVFNPHLTSLGSAFIHDVIANILNLLKEKKKIYKSDDLSIIDETHTYKIETTLKKFFSLGKITGPFRNEVKKILVQNKLSSLCYIKKVSSLTEDGSDKYFFLKEQYINVDKIGMYIGNSIEDFNIENVDLLYNSSSDLYLSINVNKYIFDQRINKAILVPYMFTQKLVNKNNINFLYKVLDETKKKLGPCVDRYSEDDIYITPGKLSNVKNVIIYVAYKLSRMSVGKDSHIDINEDELCSMGFLKKNRNGKKYLLNVYLYLKLFVEFYEWPNKTLKIIYTYKCKTPSIIIKKGE